MTRLERHQVARGDFEADDERDGGDDDARADEGQRGDALVEEEPAEGDRDDRVDVGVGGDLRDRRVLEQPGVAGEGQQRAEGDQVDEADDRAGRTTRRSGRRRPRRRSGRRRRSTRPPSSDLPGGRDERVARERDARRGERADRPHQRGADAGQQADDRRVALTGAAAATRPPKPTSTAPIAAPETRSPLSAAQQDHPQRDRGHQQGGEAGGDGLLGDADDGVGAGQHQADEAGGQQLSARGPQTDSAAAPGEDRQQDQADRR